MASGNFLFPFGIILLLYSKLFENRMFLMHFFFIVSIHSHTAAYSATQDWNWFYTQIKTRKSKALSRTVHVFRVVFILRELCPSSSLYIFEKKNVISSGRILCFVTCSLKVLPLGSSEMTLKYGLKPCNTLAQSQMLSFLPTSKLNESWKLNWGNLYNTVTSKWEKHTKKPQNQKKASVP